MSVIEVVLAIVVLIIVLLPASILINNAILASNDQRLKVEADNLATANLEKVQQEAQSGPLSGGTTSFTYQSRSGSQYTVFTVTTQFTPLSESGGASSFTTVCQNGGATQLQIWSVTATVTWTGMRGARPVTVTTDVAPGEAGAADLLDGEIAIPVNGVNGTPISKAINYYVTPNGTGAAAWLAAWLAANPPDSTSLPGIPGNTGTTGCGVVTALPVLATAGYPDIPQWTWTVELSPNTTPAPGYVATTEASDLNPAGPPLSGPITLHPGEISYALNSNSQQFQVALGVQTTVTFQTMNFVHNVKNVTTTSGQNSVSTALGFPGVAAGMGVAGTGIANGTTVVSVSGTTLTISTAATATGSATLTFSGADPSVNPAADLPITVANPGVGPTGQYTFGNSTQSIAQMLLYPFTSGYSVWAGDMPESNPGDAPSGSPIYTPDSGVTLPIGTSTSATVVVPVYPLVVNVAGATTATEVDGGGASYSLGGAPGAGMPLGQYQITPSATSLYVWITPTGTCSSPTQLVTPCATPSTNPIT
jgi:hypothetical protein